MYDLVPLIWAQMLLFICQSLCISLFVCRGARWWMACDTATPSSIIYMIMFVVCVYVICALSCKTVLTESCIFDGANAYSWNNTARHSTEQYNTHTAQTHNQRKVDAIFIRNPADFCVCNMGNVKNVDALNLPSKTSTAQTNQKKKAINTAYFPHITFQPMQTIYGNKSVESRVGKGAREKSERWSLWEILMLISSYKCSISATTRNERNAEI